MTLTSPRLSFPVYPARNLSSAGRGEGGGVLDVSEQSCGLLPSVILVGRRHLCLQRVRGQGDVSLGTTESGSVVDGFNPACGP